MAFPAFCAPSFAPSLSRPSSLGAQCDRRLRVRTAARRHAQPRAPVTAMAGPVRSTETDTPKKEFVDRLKALEKVRLIVRNEAGILESIADFSTLFFATIPSGEYANIIQPNNNVDLHLLLDKFAGAKFEIGVSRTASRVPTYSIRLLASDRETVALSVFLQWDKEPEDISAARIQAWKDIKADYVSGDSDTFFFD